jgi:hypothetical protein
LKHKPDPALLRWHGKKILTLQHDRSLIGAVEPGDEAQGGRFSAPRRTEEGEELSSLDRQVDAIHGANITERFVKISHFKFRH